MHLCPFYDQATKKCKLWDTYQSAYIIENFCCGPYWDSYKNCENYRKKY